jgi:hypothetical protein
MRNPSQNRVVLAVPPLLRPIYLRDCPRTTGSLGLVKQGWRAGNSSNIYDNSASSKQSMAKSCPREVNRNVVIYRVFAFQRDREHFCTSVVFDIFDDLKARIGAPRLCREVLENHEQNDKGGKVCDNV